MLSGEQLAYIAGIVDGEGSISIIRTKQKARPVGKRNSRSANKPNPGTYDRTLLKVSVAMTDHEIPEWLHHEFGGALFYRSYPDKNWAERCDWNITGPLAMSFLKSVQPYLRLKQYQAMVAITYQERRVPHLALKDIDKEIDRILCDTMNKLNQRGKVEDAAITA